MNYLTIKDPVAMHRAVAQQSRSDWASISRLDQIDALVREVLSVAGANTGMGGDPTISQLKERALRTCGESELPDGALRIVRIHPANPGLAMEYEVTALGPVESTAPVGYCNVCSQHVSKSVPFLYPHGTVIVQIDMCPSCADRFVAKGHKPYMLVQLHRFLEVSDGD